MEYLTETQERVLQLLRTHGDLSVPEMVQREPSLSKGTAHTVVRRFQVEGYLEVVRKAAAGAVPGRQQVFFKITRKGEDALRKMLVLHAVEQGLTITVGGKKI